MERVTGGASESERPGLIEVAGREASATDPTTAGPRVEDGDPMNEKVVLVLEDARHVKGLVEGFDPGATESVSVTGIDAAGRPGETREIPVGEIRAAFFVHDLAPFRRYRMPDRLGPPQVEVRPLNGEVRVRLELEWGERLHGIVRPHDRDGRWFAFVPTGADRAGNLIRALIAADAIVEAEGTDGP